MLEDTIGQCDVVIAVIGRDGFRSCLTAVADSMIPRTGFESSCAVRSRRSSALSLVLVDGARMPLSTELPEDIRALTRHHGVELGEAAWSSQVTQLMDSFAWRAHVRGASARHRVVALRFSGAEHLLSVRTGVVTDSVTVDGHFYST
jgi:hypothetical protein